MLVLTRKLHETIIIDGRIVVTVTYLKGGKVKLGITAPKEVSVQRSEVADRYDEGGNPK